MAKKKSLRYLSSSTTPFFSDVEFDTSVQRLQNDFCRLRFDDGQMPFGVARHKLLHISCSSQLLSAWKCYPKQSSIAEVLKLVFVNPQELTRIFPGVLG